MNGDTILQVRNFSVEFSLPAGRFRAVNQAGFDVRRGEVLAIVGESGSGKSVLTQSLVKLIPSPPSRICGGEALFQNQDLLSLSRKAIHSIRGRKIAVIFQDAMTALNPTMRIGAQITESLLAHFRYRRKRRLGLARALLEGQDVDAWLSENFYVESETFSAWRGEVLSLLQGSGPLKAIIQWIKKRGNMSARGAKKVALNLLKLVKIPDPEKRFSQYIFQLSGGMRQRIMIAIAMACRPDLIIADEPTTALDVTIKGEVLDLLIELKRRLGISVILITHDLGIVASYADRIGVLYTGEFVEMGTVDDVFYRPRHPYTLGLLHSIPRLDQESGGDLKTIEGNPPNPMERQEGCPFAPRCPYGLYICRTALPPKTGVGEGHWAACFLLDERASAAAAQSGYLEERP